MERTPFGSYALRSCDVRPDRLEPLLTIILSTWLRLLRFIGEAEVDSEGRVDLREY